MSMPTTDYNQQLLGFLQTWRQLLEQWGAITAAFPNAPFVMPIAPAGVQFMPPGMPFIPAGTPPTPPTAPLAPPSPADYTQQLFGYLRAWRQYLEQMVGARPASPEPSTTNYDGNQPLPATPPVIRRPPYKDDGGRATGPGTIEGSTNASAMSTAPSNEGAPASAYASRIASTPAKLPPVGDALAPANQGGSQLPEHMSVDLDGGLRRIPNPPGHFGGPAPPAVFRPPIYDYGNQWVPGQYRPEAVSPTGAPAPPPRRSPAAELAQRAVGSPFRGVMGRVTPDASSQVKSQTLFKNAGQTP